MHQLPGSNATGQEWGWGWQWGKAGTAEPRPSLAHRQHCQITESSLCKLLPARPVFLEPQPDPTTIYLGFEVSAPRCAAWARVTAELC